MTGSHDERRLLTLDEANLRFGIFWQKVLSEEALMKDEAFGQLPPHLTLQDLVVNPSVVALAMSAGIVGHDVTGTHSLLFINLPEDDIAVLRYTYLIVFKDALQYDRGKA